MKLITICIATFKRQKMLRILLEEINKQSVPADTKICVAVADNDERASSKAVVEDFSKQHMLEVKYAVQPKKGIPYTRNKAISLVDPKSDFVIFVDDDEFPEQNWIVNILKAQEEFDADLVSGPAYPVFESKPPRWILKGNFFLRPHYAKLKRGDKLPYINVATNNVLIRYSKLASIPGPFDERLGLIGCDDTDMARRLNDIGVKMVWTDDAVVKEWISPERANFKWLIKRAYRTANTKWILEPKKNAKNFIKIFTAGLARIFIGTLALIPATVSSLFVGVSPIVHYLRIIVRGAAIIAGLFGYNYEEYKVRHVSN